MEVERQKRIVARKRDGMFLADAWDTMVQGIAWFYDHLASSILSLGSGLGFHMPVDEPPQGQSNRALLVLIKSIEYQIQERIASLPISEDTMLEWNTALMVNAARRTDIPYPCEIWLDEDGNLAPYNDGIVPEYPKM